MSPALAGKTIFNDAAVKHNGTSSFNGTSTVLDISCLKQIPLQARELIIEMLKNIIYFMSNSLMFFINSFISKLTKTKYKKIKVINNKANFFI